jgi:hypothetical protein
MGIAEQFAEDYLKKYVLRPERFGTHQMRRGKTPDFRVFKDEELALFCEAKHIEQDEWLDKQLKNALSAELVGGSRPDPIHNRLSTRIHDAAKQFNAVNPGHSYPNVLIFANSDRQCAVDDLRSVLTGNFHVRGGADEPIYKQYSEGRIREEKFTIDLFVWWDAWRPADKVARSIWGNSKHRESIETLLPKAKVKP